MCNGTIFETFNRVGNFPSSNDLFIMNLRGCTREVAALHINFPDIESGPELDFGFMLLMIFHTSQTSTGFSWKVSFLLSFSDRKEWKSSSEVISLVLSTAACL